MDARCLRLLLAPLLLMLGLSAAGVPATTSPDILASKAKIRFRKPKGGEPRDSLNLQVTFADLSLPASFHPAVDGVGVWLGSEEVIALPSAEVEPKVKVKRSGAIQVRLPARKLIWFPTGTLRLKLRRLDLSQISNHEDVPLTIRLGETVIRAQLDFYVASSRAWFLVAAEAWEGDPDDDGWPAPIPIPNPDPPQVPLAWRYLDHGRDSNFKITTQSWCEIRIARNQTEWDALWVQHRGYGTPFEVDFANEMVVGYFALDCGGGPGYSGPELLCANVGEKVSVFRYLTVCWPMLDPIYNTYHLAAATPVSVPVTYENKSLHYVTWAEQGVPAAWRTCW